MSSDDDQRWSVTPQTRRLMEQVAQLVARQLGEGISGAGMEGKVGFCLMLFTWEPGFITHCSNGERADLVKVFREYADALEQRLEEPPIKGDLTDG